MRLRFVMTEMLLGLRRNLTLTLAVIVTVAVSLALTASGLLLRSQVGSMKNYFYNQLAVEVYLCTPSDGQACNHIAVSDAQRAQIGKDLQALPEVKSVHYESAEEAFKHFKVQFKDQPELVRSASPAVLGDSFRVKLKDPNKFAVVSSEFGARPGVSSVQDEKHVLERIFKVLGAFQAIALVTATSVLLAAIVLIGNTIRVAVFSRRREIGIMRLVGASNLYIQLPFLLEGALTGLVGGVVALGGILAVKYTLIDHQLKPAFAFSRNAFVTWGTVMKIGIGLTFAGILVSALVAFVTLSLSRATRV